MIGSPYKLNSDYMVRHKMNQYHRLQDSYALYEGQYINETTIVNSIDSVSRNLYSKLVGTLVWCRERVLKLYIWSIVLIDYIFGTQLQTNQYCESVGVSLAKNTSYTRSSTMPSSNLKDLSSSKFDNDSNRHHRIDEIRRSQKKYFSARKHNDTQRNWKQQEDDMGYLRQDQQSINRYSTVTPTKSNFKSQV